MKEITTLEQALLECAQLGLTISFYQAAEETGPDTPMVRLYYEDLDMQDSDVVGQDFGGFISLVREFSQDIANEYYTQAAIKAGR